MLSPADLLTSNFMTKSTQTKLKPIHITDRDKRLLRTIAEYGVVSTEHIRYLLFPSIGRARKRLRQLWQHGFLLRIDRPTRLGEGTKTKLYRCTRKSTKLVVLSQSGVVTSNAKRTISSTYAEHQLSINRSRVCLELAVKRTPGIALINWIPDRGAKFRVPVFSGSRQQHTVIIPDATFTLWSGNQSFGYFLEMDLGTTSLSRIKTKLLGYLELFRNPAEQTAKPHPRFRVLLVVNSEARLNSILNAIGGLPRSERRTDILLLTQFDRFGYEAPEALFSPIWSTVSTDRNILHDQPLHSIFRHSRQRQVNHQCIVKQSIHGKGKPRPGR